MKRMRLLVSAGEQELLANVEVAERDQQIINLSGLNSATLLLRMKQKDIASLHVSVVQAPFFSRLQEIARA